MGERKRNYPDDLDDTFRKVESKYRISGRREEEMSTPNHRMARPNHRSNGYHRERSAYVRDSASPEVVYDSPYGRNRRSCDDPHEDDQRSSFHHPQKYDKRRHHQPRHSEGAAFEKRWTYGESSRSLVDEAAVNPPQESSDGLQNGSKNTQGVVQGGADDTVNNTEQAPPNLQNGPIHVNKDRNAELVNIVQKYPHLYDPMDFLYVRNKAEKEKSWAAISKEFGESPENCEKRWKSLYDRYRRIEKRMDEGQLNIPDDQIQFKNTINFLPPRKRQPAETQAARGASWMERYQAASSTNPSVNPDQSFANTIMGELQSFSQQHKIGIKAEIFGILQKWANIAENENNI